MTSTVYVVANQSYHELEAARQAHLEMSLRRVCGSRFDFCDSVGDVISVEDFSDSIFVVPVLLPHHHGDVESVRREIARYVPVSGLFGVLFALFAGDGFSPDDLLGGEWVDMIDSLYEQAVPTLFIVLHGDQAQIQTFHLVSTVSALFRDLDNLQELRRISEVLYDLEDRVGNLEEPVD
jgi:hypothetical protein